MLIELSYISVCSMLEHGYEFGISVVNSNGIVGTVLHNVLHTLPTAL